MQIGKRDKSDALVFFGATGDLAYKKIFPALHAMARRGELDVPVVGVADRASTSRGSWNTRAPASSSTASPTTPPLRSSPRNCATSMVTTTTRRPSPG